MKFKIRNYDLDNNSITESVEEVNTPQVDRMQQMAEQRPGEVVVGIKLDRAGETEHESEKYLSDQ